MGFLPLLRTAWVEYERDHARYLAAAMIYYAMMSLVPLLLLLLAALGLMLRLSGTAAHARQKALLSIQANFGAELAESIQEQLNVLQEQSPVVIIIGLVGLLLTASVLFKHLRMSFRAIWKVAPVMVSGSVGVIAWTTILERTKAFVMLLCGGALLLTGLTLMAVTQWMGGLFGSGSVLDYTLTFLLAALSSFLFAALTFAFLFKFLPPVRLRWSDVWLATLLCAGSWVIASEFLTLYGIFFENNRTAFGAIGGLLAFMLGMNAVSQMLFFGAELCKVIASGPSGNQEIEVTGAST